MLLGHSSYYFNGIWNHLDPFDPLFPTRAQFILRYIGYLCAPGFLMMSGAMVWWSFQQHTKKDMSPMKARWHLIQRGLFLVLVQVTWVNSSWGGFKEFQPGHLGIIACIGLSMVLLTVFINTQWYIRLLVAIAMLIIHPFLLQITYDPKIVWQEVVMQTFLDAGDFNKYPVMPWFALMILGSVMATAWIKIWKTDKQRILYGALIAAGAILLAIGVRMGRGFGNILPFSDFGTYTFFIDQKYPPSLFHNLWFFGWVVAGVTLFIGVGKLAPRLLSFLSIPGKVPLFFYAMHLAILGVFIKRFDLLYREGGVWESLLGLVIMTAIMLPLCKWFYRVKLTSKNYFIRLI